MLSRLYSILFLLYFIVSSLFFFSGAGIVWLLTIAFDRRLAVLHLYSCFWASTYLWVNPAWSVRVEGREHIRKGQTYVIVSNHQSALDILVGYRLFIPFKWVGKAELFKVPIIGWNMILNRYIKVQRGSREGARRMLEASEKALAQGSSIFIFPEGTRTEDGTVGRFKTGAFVLAEKMKVPVLPVAIEGSMDALPKNSLHFKGHHHITLRVLPEIPYQPGTSADALSRQAQGQIVAAVEALRASRG